MAHFNPLSDVGCNRESLDVGNDISSRIDQIKVEDLVSDVGCNSDLLDVCDDISSRIGHMKVEGSIDLEYDNVSCTSHGTVFLDGSVAIWPLQDAMRLHHPVVMAANSCIHSSMV